MDTPLYKLSGGGNDFVARVVVPPGTDGADAAFSSDAELERHLPTPQLVRDWTRRGLSLGADGFILLGGIDDIGGIGNSRVRMIYVNGDGTRADLCLNGTRCAARLAFELGWHDPDTGRVTVVTDSGPFPARRIGPTEISLTLPRLEQTPEERAPEAGGRTWPGWSLTVGVPHFVVPWHGDLAEAPVATVGPLLRHHEAFAPAGTNVDFVRFPEEGEPAGQLALRSYERGVEAETLACGTGVVATTLVALDQGLVELPVEVMTRGGFVLRAHRDEGGDDGRDEPVGPSGPGSDDTGFCLSGDARIVARITPTDEASGLPERPWD